MITLLDTVGPAVLRASWQAAVLALVVMLLLRLLGERISPRWRYLPLERRRRPAARWWRLRPVPGARSISST